MTQAPQPPQIPPGWYDDGQGALRWWDGAAWTGHVQPIAPTTTTTPAASGGWPAYGVAAPVPPRRSLAWLWVLLGVVGVLVVTGMVIGIVKVAERASRHEVPDAERVTRDFMASPDQTTAAGDLGPGFAANSRGLCDLTQAHRLAVPGVRYRIADSHHTSGGALVDVDLLDSGGLTLTFDLTDAGHGWKITRMACHGGE
jgi:hypothetical protein